MLPLAMVTVQKALRKLSATESEVITSYFGLTDRYPKTLEEIGDKIGLTRERVRQIKEKATKKLLYHSTGNDLKSYLG